MQHIFCIWYRNKIMTTKKETYFKMIHKCFNIPLNQLIIFMMIIIKLKDIKYFLDGLGILSR